MKPNLTELTQENYDRIVKTILDQPGYRHLKIPWADFAENARKTIENWVVEVLRKLFDQPLASTPFSGGLSVAVIILSAVALIALLLLAASLFTGMFERSSKLSGILGEAITAETTPETLMEKARVAERSGDTRQAVRYGFIAVLLKMHRARLVFLDEAWTNQELYLHLEKNRFGSLEALESVMAGFNAAWYGHKPVNALALAQWQNDLEQVWQEVASHES